MKSRIELIVGDYVERPGPLRLVLHAVQQKFGYVPQDSVPPEYKVTAVQVIKVTQPSLWQQRFREIAARQRRIVRESHVGQT